MSKQSGVETDQVIAGAAVEGVLCCSPLVRQPLTADQSGELAGVFKALGDPVRLRLLSLIASHVGGEACVCDLTDAFELTGPTISHHLKVLREAGVIEGERRGTWVYYRVLPTTLQALATVLTTAQPAELPEPPARPRRTKGAKESVAAAPVTA